MLVFIPQPRQRMGKQNSRAEVAASSQMECFEYPSSQAGSKTSERVSGRRPSVGECVYWILPPQILALSQFSFAKRQKEALRKNSCTGQWLGVLSANFWLSFPIFLSLSLLAMEVLGPGIEPASQKWPKPQQWLHQILNPLSHKGTPPHPSLISLPANVWQNLPLHTLISLLSCFFLLKVENWGNYLDNIWVQLIISKIIDGGDTIYLIFLWE